jgi:hypothetical protein
MDIGIDGFAFVPEIPFDVKLDVLLGVKLDVLLGVKLDEKEDPVSCVIPTLEYGTVFVFPPRGVLRVWFFHMRYVGRTPFFKHPNLGTLATFDTAFRKNIGLSWLVGSTVSNTLGKSTPTSVCIPLEWRVDPYNNDSVVGGNCRNVVLCPPFLYSAGSECCVFSAMEDKYFNESSKSLSKPGSD